MFRFGGVKIFIDGIGHDAHGAGLNDMKWTEADLNDFVWRTHSAGLQIIMHHATAESFRIAVRAVELAQQRERLALRHRLEHADTIVTVEDMRRVRDLGMLVVFTLPQDRPPRAAYLERFPRYATLIREGLEIVGMSDATGTIPEFSPLNGIASIVAPRSEGGSAPPGEASTMEDAMRMCTLWAAKAQFEEGSKGSIAPGKLGDFAVLSNDIGKLSGGALFDLRVDATILGGKLVHQNVKRSDSANPGTNQPSICLPKVSGRRINPKIKSRQLRQRDTTVHSKYRLWPPLRTPWLAEIRQTSRYRCDRATTSRCSSVHRVLQLGRPSESVTGGTDLGC
jgi:predicted amidohydrolase YtcJ